MNGAVNRERKTEYSADDFDRVPSIVAAAAARGERDVAVTVEPGVYETRGITLGAVGGMRLTLCAAGPVRLVGGRLLHGFSAVTDPDVMARLKPEARDRVLTCDLTANGVSAVSGLTSRGFARPVTPSHSEVFQSTRPLCLARYPKTGRYLTIDRTDMTRPDEWGNPVGDLKSGFYYRDQHPAAWRADAEIWVHGYWAYDWANSYERVVRLDAARQHVATAPPYGNFYFRPGQRFYFLNMLEEVTEPGDYYIDRQRMRLYFIPLEGESLDDVVLSLSDRPAIAVDGAENVTLEGFTIEAFRGHGLTVAGSRRVTVKNCVFRNIGNYAVSLADSENVTVCGCTIHDCGDGGVDASGGDRPSLRPADICICNNHIWRIAQWSRCYQPAIRMTGVGMTACHNLIHDCPHTAVLYWGNDITITDNEIYSVVMETGDAGAIYSGRNYTFRGNRICRNFIHHLGGVGLGAMGIYNDDCLSGTVMEENVFFEVSRAVFLGGGRDLTVRRNIMVDCYPAVCIDSRGASENPNWRRGIRTLRDRLHPIRNVTAGNEPVGPSPNPEDAWKRYTEKYPALREIAAFYRRNPEPFIPSTALLDGNVIASARGIEFAHDTESGEYVFRGNCYVPRTDFEDPDFGDLTLAPTSSAVRFGHRPVDMRKIGLVEMQRKDNPAKVFARLLVSSGGLALQIRNRGGTAADGRYRLFSSVPVEKMATSTPTVHVEAGQTVSLVLGGMPPAGSEIEVRSETPGWRPARLCMELGNGGMK